jgi:hypothetical protein
MTDHTGLPVAGYRPQGDDKVAIVNLNKQLEERILRQIEVLQIEGIHDPRMLATAFTGIQQACMWLNRAVFRPGRVDLPEDTAPKSVAVMEGEIQADLLAEMKNFVAAVEGTTKP